MSYLSDVVSEDMRRNPERFRTYTKSKRLKYVGMSTRINKEDFLQSDISKKADILHDQFQFVYAHEKTSSILNEGPCHHKIMQKINITTPGVTELLCDLNHFKSSGPHCIPTYILKVAAEEVSPIVSRIFQV